MTDRASFNPDTSTWRYVKDYIAERLEAARAELEDPDPDTNETRTANLRGRIAELKHIDALDQPRPEIPVAGEPYS